MEDIFFTILSAQGILTIISVGLIIYFIVKKVNKNEDFEDRDN